MPMPMPMLCAEPPAEARLCALWCFYHTHREERKEKRERPPRLRDKGGGEVLESKERDRERVQRNRVSFLACRGLERRSGRQGRSSLSAEREKHSMD
jgi:hypothetical protein